ncbi:hypothetical protein ACFYM5_37175 [Streptomyces sp. NPDC006706]
MTRGAGSQGTGFACMVAGVQEPLDATRSEAALRTIMVRSVRGS